MYDHILQRLDYYFDMVDRTILCRQNPNTGLFPASTDINDHGDYTDAWVRDNVYSIQAVWGLLLAYRKTTGYQERIDQLKNSTVRLMRGLLSSMMRQAAKVERFKYTQNPMDALHAKYSTHSGDVVVDDDKWGHLQLDATSIYVLMLAQMTLSGVRIVRTEQEVHFIQNLVWYIGRAYRTPDFGIWERGNKINNGRVEINASSVGMAKAALQAIRGVNLLGEACGQRGVIHVLADEIARCRTVLEHLLPRESWSKEVDAACLSIIGYPAFAVEKKSLVQKTRSEILAKLAGFYGCKRFLRDGHQTAIEDHNRLHYELHELKNFEHIESEWPLFFTYLYLDALFREDAEQIRFYRDRLDRLRVEKDGQLLLPELYIVPHDRIEAEKDDPGSQARVANQNVPLVWTQSLYVLGCLIHEQLLDKHDIDPLRTHKRIGRRMQNPIQVAFIAEDEFVKEALAGEGIYSETQSDVEPVRILSAMEFPRLFAILGQDREMGLTGRPPRRARSLASAQFYQLQGETCLFLSHIQNQSRFHLSADNRFTFAKIKSELSYISRHWCQPQKPIQVILVTRDMLEAPDVEAVYEFARQCFRNEIEAVEIITGPLLELIDSGSVERIDELHDYQLPDNYSLSPRRAKKWLTFTLDKCTPIAHDMLSLLQPDRSDEQLISSLIKSVNLYEQQDILLELVARKGMQAEIGIAPRVTLKVLLNEVYDTACHQQVWNVVRKSAGALGRYWHGLEDAVAEIVARQKSLVVGRSYSDKGMLRSVPDNREILRLIQENTGYDDREVILNQEIIVFMAALLKDQPALFQGMKTFIPGQFMHLIMSQLQSEQALAPSDAFELLCSLSPYDLFDRVRKVLENYEVSVQRLIAQESLPATHHGPICEVHFDSKDDPLLGEENDWKKWREVQGLIPRFHDNFFSDLWNLLNHCHGIVLGDRFDSRTRMDSDIALNSMTGGEAQFANLIEKMLIRISTNSYRQMTIEVIQALCSLFKMNPDLRVPHLLVVEVILGHAVRLNWINQEDHDADQYNAERGKAWQEFYQLPPYRVALAVQTSFEYLIRQNDHAQLLDGGEGETVYDHH